MDPCLYSIGYAGLRTVSAVNATGVPIIDLSRFPAEASKIFILITLTHRSDSARPVPAEW